MIILSDRHRAELEIESAIDPAIIDERGYFTAYHSTALPDAFAEWQRRTGLVVPIRDFTGDVVAWQLKADTPRVGKNRKPVKYDTATGGRQCIDVPVRSRQHLDDPTIPLWITEGAKKVDSGLSNGIRCIVGVQGVYGWRGTNEHGGKTALVADFEAIALNGRDVVLAFDSDVMTKSEVRDALDRLSGFLTSRKARIHYLVLPNLDDEGSVS